MARPLADILALAHERAASQAGYAQQLRDIDELYYGEVDVGIPELQDRNKRIEVANLAMQGIDQHGMRIASVLPDLVWPALRASSAASRGRAEMRRRAMFGLWDENALDVALHIRSRHLITYAAAPIHLRPKKLRPGDAGYRPDNTWTVEWVLRTPHETYPAGGIKPGVVQPADTIFRYAQSSRWLRTNFPLQADIVARLRDPAGVGPPEDSQVELLEYVDADETVLAVTGTASPTGLQHEASYGLAKTVNLSSSSGGGRVWGVELDRVPNRIGVPPVVIPGRITLGRPMGQFDQMLGLFVQQAKLMALELNAVTRSVFPPIWVEDTDTSTPATVEAADPLRGKIGRIHGGRLQVPQLSPGFQTYPTIDRLTEAQRQIGLVPAEMGGYSPSNIRTGKRGADIFGNTVDFSIQEAQLLFRRALKLEDDVAVEIAKTYFRGSPKRYVVAWPAAKGEIDYRPEQIFEDGASHSVEYPAVGTDANMLGVQVGQANGEGLMSDATARHKHPLIDDAEFEDRQVTVERLRKALAAGYEQKVAGGLVGEDDVAQVIQQVIAGQTIEDATRQVHRAAQERQASSGEPGTPEGPVAPGAPEAQPGLAPPGAGAEAGTAGGGDEVPAGLSGLAQLTAALRRTSTPIGTAA